jgi:hypothetical protein
MLELTSTVKQHNLHLKILLILYPFKLTFPIAKNIIVKPKEVIRISLKSAWRRKPELSKSRAIRAKSWFNVLLFGAYEENSISTNTHHRYYHIGYRLVLLNTN